MYCKCDRGWHIEAKEAVTGGGGGRLITSIIPSFLCSDQTTGSNW